MTNFRKAPAFLQNSVRKPKGYIEINDPDGPGERGETLMCVHCQHHWIVRAGSGAKRGFCLSCNGPTCGKRVCETRCLPFEKRIEMIEAKAKMESMFG